MLMIADVGESLFAAADLNVHRRFEFLSPAYYTSMGLRSRLLWEHRLPIRRFDLSCWSVMARFK